MTEEVKVEEVKLVKIDLGCGSNKKAPEYIGVDFDKCDGVDIVHDIRITPWPFEDSSVDEVYSSHFFEHLDGKQRISFMNEAYRILKPNKQLIVITPYWTSVRASQDPTHLWPPISENTYLYFNKEWRENNKLTHGDYAAITCDFNFGYGYAMDPDIQVRSVEFQQQAVKHKVNAILDIHVTLTSKKV